MLVDDHAVVRAGFRMLLSTDDMIEVIAESDRGEVVCQLYLEKKPDVVVLDLSMPGIGGLETTRRICTRNSDAKVLVFSVHNERVYVDRAMNAGAKGYITKQSHPEIIIAAIKKIAQGETYIEPAIINHDDVSILLERRSAKYVDYRVIIESFSAREFDVFLLLAKGLTAHKIADELCIGYKTVANYGTQIRSKLNVSTVAELTHIALVSGIVKN